MILEKLSSQGNDFLISQIGCSSHPDQLSSLSIALCERHNGVGADGVIWFHKEPDDTRVFCYLFNADGTEAGFSGNGFACVCYFLGITTKLCDFVLVCRGQEFKIRYENHSVRIQCQNFTLKHWSQNVTLVDLGNPHAVVFDNQDEQIVESIFGDLSLFPDGINVNLASVHGSLILLKVHERGVGWTNSCSSGCLATAIVAHQILGIKTPVSVKQTGGTSVVSYCEATNSYYLELKPRWIATVTYHTSEPRALEI
ncbi:MAG: diaminopimelate epimerase [Candidatus Cloacimonetes bacterium]|nr:diaminopimelate epimerase [Candidatus Cloacimonadota bacterium]